MPVKVKKIGRGEYQIGNCHLKYYQNGRYDILDGKYHPGWVVTSPNGIFEAKNKSHAFRIAEKNQN